MIKKIILMTALIAVASCVALAADIDGKWTATMQGRDGGTQTQTLILTASGTSLTGSLDGGRGGAVDISDGTVDGNNVSFKVTRNFNGNQFTQQYKGTLSDSGELTLSVSFGDGGHSGGGGKRGGRGGGRQIVFKKAAN
jgi:hypothetical protein